jgi:cysteine-rich repeat protein
MASRWCAVPGCSSASRFGSTTICLSCNSSLHFEFNGLDCDCTLGYTLAAGTCALICGDGRVISEDCDDGNTINGDGCSSQCTVEPDYSCSNGSFYHSSVCVFSGPILTTLLDIRRAVDANRVEIILQLAPTIRSLSLVDFAHYLELIVGNRSLSCAASFAEDGTLTILANYDFDLEGEPATLSVGYDLSLFSSRPSELSFMMKGHNDPLMYVAESNLQSVILHLGYVVAGLSLLQLLASLAFHKMIGLETMQIAQTVFFVRYLLRN